MIYVFDSSSFIVLGHFNPVHFPTFWNNFNGLVASERVISVREVRKEIENQSARQSLLDWIGTNSTIFLPATAAETEFVSRLFSVPRFQGLIKARQLLKSGPAADPFVIASAYARKACVVTEESRKLNAIRIPTVCDYYGIECTNLDGLMEREGWKF